jgi:hypothetical protein
MRATTCGGSSVRASSTSPRSPITNKVLCSDVWARSHELVTRNTIPSLSSHGKARNKTLTNLFLDLSFTPRPFPLNYPWAFGLRGLLLFRSLGSRWGGTLCAAPGSATSGAVLLFDEP